MISCGSCSTVPSPTPRQVAMMQFSAYHTRKFAQGLDGMWDAGAHEHSTERGERGREGGHLPHCLPS